ncbi:RNA-binding motif protein, X chromosome-like [Dipodomys merriami]|uniref:RNA-binding motif protein, X chromosome-like n=1 Tax=Dipodomys merriami TaxID=94247 RepID=UPI00384A6C8D
MIIHNDFFFTVAFHHHGCNTPKLLIRSPLSRFDLPPCQLPPDLLLHPEPTSLHLARALTREVSKRVVPSGHSTLERSKRMESDQPRKLFVGGLSADTTEKDLEGIFCEFGHLEEVILLKHRQTKRSRGFAFITFERPADAQWAAKEMNGKCLDGKEIKVEPAGKSSYNHRSRGRYPPLSRSKVTQRSLSYGGGGSGRARGHSSCERPFDDGRCSLNFNVSSSRRHLSGKRSLSSRTSGPPPKRSDHSAPVRSSRRMREEGLPLCGGENYEVMPQRNPVSFQSDDYASPRKDTYSAEDRGDHLNSRDMEDYAGVPREYGYHDYYGRYSSRDERTSKSYSGHGGCDGSHDRKSHSSGVSYRNDTYASCC